MDLNEIEVTETDDGLVYEVGGEGWRADELPNLPRETNTLFTRANHLFHHIWTLAFSNFATFGTIDDQGFIAYQQPGTFAGGGEPGDADNPINIYFWQRWIAHADPTGSGLYELDFAMTFDLWTPTKHYNLHQYRFPNMPACGTSFADAVQQLNDGTANCNRTETFTEQYGSYPQEFHIAQQYFLSPEGGQFALVPAAPYEWPRPDSADASMPTFPLGLRNKTGGTDSEQCTDPANFCTDEWFMVRGGAVSAKVTFEFSTTQLMVLGSPAPTNDFFDFIGQATATTNLNEYSGSIDHYDDETEDKSGTTDRVFAWPTVAIGRKQIQLNTTSVADFADACTFSSATNPFGPQTGIPSEDNQSIKFNICDLLSRDLDVDCYEERGPDKGPVVQMDGQVFPDHADYFHVGLDMSELYSTCTGKGLTPNFRGSEQVAQRIKQNGPFPVSHSTDHISVYGAGPCETGQQTGCNPTDACACKPDQVCGEDAGFQQNIGVTGEGCGTPSGYLSMRGIFTLGKEPDTIFGTVTS
jgi:hypothetical protein